MLKTRGHDQMVGRVLALAVPRLTMDRLRFRPLVGDVSPGFGESV